MWNKLKEFVPDDVKVVDLVGKLISNELYLSDENRNEQDASAIVFSHLFGPQERALFEIGDWDGLFGVVNIVPNWKGDLFFKFWGKQEWGPDLWRELQEALEYIIDKFKLEKVSLSTPDHHTSRLAEFFGFEKEGLIKNNFMWGGEHYDVLCLGLNRRG